MYPGNGYSSPTGFELEIFYFPKHPAEGKSVQGKSAKGATPDHNKILVVKRFRRPVPKFVGIIMAVFGIAGFIAAIALTGALPEEFFLLFIAGAFILTFFFLLWLPACMDIAATLYLFLDRRLAHWHGCEHKLLFVYENEWPRTFASLKKAPRVCARCGSMPGFKLFLRSLGPPVALGGLLMLGSTLFYIPLLLLFVALVWLIPKTALSLQWLIATAEPTQDQYQAALELAARLDAKINERNASLPGGASLLYLLISLSLYLSIRVYSFSFSRDFALAFASFRDYFT